MKTYNVFFFLLIAFTAFDLFPQQAGDLDASFGNGGIVLVDLVTVGAEASSSLIQPDGKIVLAGTANELNTRYMCATRLNTDGTLDLSFSGDGKLVLPLITDIEYGEQVLLQNGKLIVAGYTNEGYFPKNFVMNRINSNGTIDNSFGVNGKVETDFLANTSWDGAYTGAVSGNKIILAGETYMSQYNSDFALARYNEDGSLDNSFGNGGLVVTDFFPNSRDRINDMAIQPDGKIIAVGSTAGQYPSPWSWALARYNPDGTLDNSFGTNGKVVQSWAALYDALVAIALLPDGKFLVAGTKNEIRRVVARYNSDGTLDNSFGDAGETEIPGEGPSIIVYGNKIFAATSLGGINGYDFIISRLNYGGGLDNTFGNGGSLSITILSDGDFARDINIQSDGKIIVSGDVYNNTNQRHLLAAVRYLNDPLQPNVPFFIIDDLWNQGFINFSTLGDPAVTEVSAVAFPGSIPPGSAGDAFFSSGIVNRYYDISVTPQNAGANSGYNASLRLYYTEDEVQGIDESKLKLVRNSSNGWIYVGGTVNTTENYVEANNVNEFGIFAFADPDSISNISSDENGLVNEFALEQNYPNPFNPSTKISWQSPTGSQQTIIIYDVLGNEVATLVDEFLPTSTYEVEWNAVNVPSGVYFYKLQAGSFVETKKMILIK